LPPPSKEWERDPVDDVELPVTTRVSFVGTTTTIAPRLKAFVEATGADELIVVSHIYAHEARLRSYELAASVSF
jgi:alkanesulfonate monooxygenase SsuD/methylene tetrahydromethanopterin reductase-like flavin-dependent oxidoreductase (luciferase family)